MIVFYELVGDQYTPVGSVNGGKVEGNIVARLLHGMDPMDEEEILRKFDGPLVVAVKQGPLQKHLNKFARMPLSVDENGWKYFDDAQALNPGSEKLVEDFPYEQLIASQDFLDNKTLDRYSQGWDGEKQGYPTVVRYKGNHYINDGHHRIVSDLRNGKKSGKVWVIDHPGTDDGVSKGIVDRVERLTKELLGEEQPEGYTSRALHKCPYCKHENVALPGFETKCDSCAYGFVPDKRSFLRKATQNELHPWRKTDTARFTELIPTEFAYNYREFDRGPSGIHGSNYDEGDEWEKFKHDIATNGIREPLIFGWDPKVGAGKIIEGNHRVRAAKELALTHVPVRMCRYDFSRDISGHKPKPLDGHTLGSLTDRFGYTPGDLRPSQVMPDVAHLFKP